jgi:CheY-like chemotaxis protein
VLEAVNGREGIDLALRHRPRVIICDLMMPERDGMDVLRAIRAAPQTQDTAFCFVTGSAEKSTREQSYAAGVDAYLTKPFDLAELRATIVALLR